MADLSAGVRDLEVHPGLGQVVAHSQPGLAAADHQDVQGRARGPGGHRAGSGRRATLKLNIMPLWLCSAMWQWAIHSPGLETSSKMSTVSPARSSTVSFHTRLGSGCPSRDRTRNRPAPWMWNG